MRIEDAALREKELYEALAGWNVASAITVGGYAVSARSFTRYSHDFDALLRSDDLEAARAALSGAGLEFVKRAPRVEENYGGSFEQWTGGKTKVTVDLLVDSVQDRKFRVPLPYDLLAERAEVLPMRGVTTSQLRFPVACGEALIAMKLQPLRTRDRGDVCCLAGGPVDERHLRRVLGPLIKQRPDLLAQRLSSLADDLATEGDAQRLLGPRIPGPASRRAPIIRSARELVRLARSWLP